VYRRGIDTSVSNTYDGILHWQPFDSWPSSGWTKVGSVTVTGGALKLAGNGSWNATYAYHTANLKDGQAIRFRFKTDSTTTEAYLSLDRGTWEDDEYRSWTLRLEGGYIKREYYQGTTSNKVSLMALKSNVWYEGVLAIDGTDPAGTSESYAPRFRLVVWERENPNNWQQSLQSFAEDWSYADWKFISQMKTSLKNLYIDYVNEYDDGAIGQRTAMSDGSGSTAWEYTTRGQAAQESKVITGSGTYITKWGYHPDGSLRWMQYPDDEKLSYTYHPQKTLNSLQTSLDSGLYYVASTAYDEAGRIVTQKIGGTSALQKQFTYFLWDTPNGQGRLKQIKAGTTANPTLLLDLRYYSGADTPKYDPVGNILNIYDHKMGSPQTQTFTYDNLDRLTSAQATGGTNGNYTTESYSYNLTTGNLATKAGVTYTYGDSNHAHAVTSLSNGNTYSYDSNGNQLTRYVGGSTYTLTYDAENRLVSVSGAVTASFVFDGDGNRVKSTIASTTTTFVGTYYEVTGSSVTKYYYAGTNRIALRNSSGVRYIFGDHLGSTSITADGSGGNMIRQLYKAWGEVRYSSGSLPTKYTYTGQYSYASTGEIGLLYYVARFYDPWLSRFISADSIIPEPGNPLAWDRYLYVFGKINQKINNLLLKVLISE
jgi:RHS repeat-associated protein